MTRNHNEQQAHVDPAEEPELSAQLIALQVSDEAYKAEHVKHEGDESMMARKWNEVRIDKDDVL